MKRRTVNTAGRIPSPPFVQFKPIWDRGYEVPVCTVKYDEGYLIIWGTGMVEVILSAVSIVVRMAFRVVSGRFRWRLAQVVREELSMALRKMVIPAEGSGPVGPGADDKSTWPNLWDHLTRTAYDDGQAREKSSVVIVANAGGWSGCVSDKDNGRVMWKTATTVEGLLLALEEGLELDDPSSWRLSTPEKFRKRK